MWNFETNFEKARIFINNFRCTVYKIKTRFLEAVGEEKNEVDPGINLNPFDTTNMKYAILVSCNMGST